MTNACQGPVLLFLNLSKTPGGPRDANRNIRREWTKPVPASRFTKKYLQHIHTNITCSARQSCKSGRSDLQPCQKHCAPFLGAVDPPACFCWFKGHIRGIQEAKVLKIQANSSRPLGGSRLPQKVPPSKATASKQPES